VWHPASLARAWKIFTWPCSHCAWQEAAITALLPRSWEVCSKHESNVSSDLSAYQLRFLVVHYIRLTFPISIYKKTRGGGWILTRLRVFCNMFSRSGFFICIWLFDWWVQYERPPLWSSIGQSSWLQSQRYRARSRRYQISWVVVSLERGPPSLVRINEELLERKSGGSGLANRD
jgi:hypothetical protein